MIKDFVIKHVFMPLSHTDATMRQLDTLTDLSILCRLDALGALVCFLNQTSNKEINRRKGKLGSDYHISLF